MSRHRERTLAASFDRIANAAERLAMLIREHGAGKEIFAAQGDLALSLMKSMTREGKAVERWVRSLE
jgi:hypothetical protein